jgi:signal transduction histidine kinase
LSEIFRLLLEGPADKTCVVEVQRGQDLFIGADPEGAVTITGDGILPRHLRFTFGEKGGSVLLRRAESKAEVQVNGDDVESASLVQGDEIAAGPWKGKVLYVFHDPDGAELDASVADIEVTPFPMGGSKSAPLMPGKIPSATNPRLDVTEVVKNPITGPTGTLKNASIDELLGNTAIPSPPQADGGWGNTFINTTSRFEDLDAIFVRIEDDRQALLSLYHLLKRLNQIKERSDILDTLAELILENFAKAPHVYIFTRTAHADPGFTPMVVKSRLDDGNEAQSTMSQTLLSHMLAKREALIFTDTDQALQGAKSIVMSQLKSGIIAPLWDNNNVQGVVQVECQERNGVFRQKDLDLVTLMANQAALVLSNQEMTQQLQKAYSELEGVNQSLEGLVKERTGELAKAKEEAEHARVIAEQANQAKSAFLANMSHELRTPMNAIIGYSEMLIEDAEDLEQEDFIPDLEKVLSAAKHLLGLINGVLDLSKVEAGKMDLYLESFPLTELIDEIGAIVKPLVEKNKNTFVRDLADDIGVMHADVTKVRQAVFNMLSNACRFTESGTITLRIRRVREDDQEWITFEVVDTGIGMTPAQMGKLFQPFTQADVSTTRKYGGTGLGLALSRTLCRMMGGDITVQSEEGQGSTFTIRLPAVVAKRKGEADQAADDLSGEGAPVLDDAGESLEGEETPPDAKAAERSSPTAEDNDTEETQGHDKKTETSEAEEDAKSDASTGDATDAPGASASPSADESDRVLVEDVLNS